MVKLHPDLYSIKSSPGLIPYVLSDQNKVYAVFLRAIGTAHTNLQIETGDGLFQVQEINTITGAKTDPVMITAWDSILSIEVAIPQEELALKIIK